MEDLLPLRSLLLEAGAIVAGGWHNGSGISVAFRHADNDVVVHHERVHDRVLRGTTQGRWLATVLTALAADVANPVLREALEYILSTSESAHESFATYLSVKTLPPGEQRRIVEAHPKIYRSFYEGVASVLDPHFHSSYLQYSVAVQMMYLCFSCDNPLPFFDALPERFVRPDPADAPNLKLERMVRSIAAQNASPLIHELQALVDQVCTDLGDQSWDVQGEAEWASASKRSAQHAEEAMAPAIRRWLELVSGIVWSPSTELEAMAHRKLAERLGGSFRVTREPSNRVELDDPQLKFAVLGDSALRASEGTIENSHAPIVNGRLEQLWSPDFPKPSFHRITIGGASPEQDLFRAMISSPTEIPSIPGIYVSSGFELDGDGSKRAFADVATARVLPWIGSSAELVDVAVLAIRSAMEQALWMRRIMSLSDTRPGWYWRELCLVWYARGSFYYELLRKRSKPFYAYKVVTWRKGRDIVFHVLQKSPDELYVRAFNNVDSGSVAAFEAALVERGILRKGPHPAYQHLSRRIEDALAFACYGMEEL